MRACVRLDDRVCSGWFAVLQSLCRGCALTPLLFDIFFEADINVAYMRFKADDKDIMGALVHLKKKKGVWGRGAGGRREETARESALAMLL